MRETWVQSLGWENPLEEGMATHSSILAWRLPTDREVWQATLHGVTKSQTRLSDWTELSIPRLEEGMATHSSILAWRIAMDRAGRRATVHGVS